MAVLIPRARMDLSSSCYDFLGLDPNLTQHYQNLLDQSELEKRVQAHFKEQVIPLVSTKILPTELAKTLYKEQHLPEFSLLILVSKHAALLARSLLSEQALSRVRMFAVGSTCQAFFDDYQLAISSGKQESAKGLLALDALQDLSGEKVLLMKGEAGLDVLEQECRARHAHLTVIDLYKREANLVSRENLLEMSITGIYAVSVFALEHFLLSLASLDQAEQGKLDVYSRPLFAMSERIANQAEVLGFKNIQVLSLES